MALLSQLYNFRKRLLLIDDHKEGMAQFAVKLTKYDVSSKSFKGPFASLDSTWSGKNCLHDSRRNRVSQYNRRSFYLDKLKVDLHVGEESYLQKMMITGDKHTK